MCGGVYYTHNGLDTRFYFPNPKAKLPVRQRSGSVALLPWGRRQEQRGVLPLGGWARLDSIYGGRWDRWFPVPVKLPLKSFMERDIEGQSHWFDLVRGQWIQGLVARDGSEQRIYIVTVEPELESAVHERWPRILNG
ncbi:hypothetical protein BOW53_10385 [Solemya pervernicosa gill symbiont]|uniref:Uncharacterized protein n=1 Tax=Solemya pervernicosa gill symbiont TaxID=642797 RepID=A0A1T2L3N7_9GAMM|nr:hypothetical protein [Solemya pervernicosa gill symbiont]OOZ39717.1 hypothetical protein BOW53_10385 [Solemya pervernicosa gill symbiont]